jgi:hypothetical protein
LQFSSGIVSPVKYLAVLRPAQDPCVPLPAENRFSLPADSVRAGPSVRSTGLIRALLSLVFLTVTVCRCFPPTLPRSAIQSGECNKPPDFSCLPYDLANSTAPRALSRPAP